MKRVLKLMKERGLNRTELTALLGIKNQNFTSLMRNPTLKTMQRVADALNVPLWQLFTTLEEVEDETTITCPECGYRIEIRVE